MSQHDFNIANQSFPATRTDLNNALVALASNSSGDAEPGTTYANQWWYETDTNKLKIRNEANNAWIEIATLDQSSNNVLSITTQGLTLGATALTATATELNLLDALTRGSIIYGNASGVTSELVKGGAGTVLTSDGTDISWAAAGGGGGMEFISSSGEMSGAASASFTGFDSSKYDNYVFYLNYVKPATDNQKLFAYASTNGGSSYDETNGNYHFNGIADTTGFNINHQTPAGNDTNEYGIAGELRLFKPQASAYTTTYVATVVYNSSSYLYRGADGDYRGSAYLSTSEVNAIQFKFGSGNIASGEIVMFGIVNS